ncbi:hypothetical protein GCM10022210_41310 [Mucilaginibacter dorajii]|uniref:Uncharacterized protein n=2 Tax=Mucilaginibacter dorajii TaxID=692994 RepID=A0ABP7QMA8_9SPHI
MRYKYLFIFLLTIHSFCGSVPVQPQSANYSGKLKGKAMQLKLANGFIGGSEIHIGNVTYYANSGRPEANNTMLFQSKYLANGDYFVLNNMQQSYNPMPATISGKYFKSRRGVAVKFLLDK